MKTIFFLYRIFRHVLQYLKRPQRMRLTRGEQPRTYIAVLQFFAKNPLGLPHLQEGHQPHGELKKSPTTFIYSSFLSKNGLCVVPSIVTNLTSGISSKNGLTASPRRIFVDTIDDQSRDSNVHRPPNYRPFLHVPTAFKRISILPLVAPVIVSDTSWNV